MIIESIKEGFKLANNNLQLVLMRIAVTIINLIVLFIFIGLPVIAAIAYLGFDLAQAKDLLPFLVKNPFEFISKYLALMFIIGTSFVFYLIFTSTLFLYALGGTLGVLKNSAVNIQYKFSISSFFKEANINFSRLFRLVSLLLSGVIVLFLLFIVSGVIVAVVMQAVTEAGSALEMFFSSFAMLTIVIFSIIIVAAGFIFAVYSMIALVIEGKGVMDSIRSAFDFLKKMPQALLFYVILFIGIIAVNVIFYGIQLSFSVVPVMTPLIYLLNVFFQNYLAIVLWSSLIVYYIKGTDYPVYYAGYEI
ncbi:MAG TPA: hypothetical protein ENG83_15810 [Nitrospirae bacterium]|nr:hypothetical protein BMS3Abin06_02039 [bacterium BMS3Abin06]HDH13635.1 hypothetical protein [Nitrospirota bacterium]HDZ00909.1 hypothetical protein [Nitrospirota bacterium]